MRPVTLEALAAAVPDGALVALPPDTSLPPVALAMTLARRGARGLRLLGVPVSGVTTDLLIGAGCVAELETSAVTLGEAGAAPCFQRALRAGSLVLRDATCPAIHTALQAAEKGVPFLPLRGVLGSDLLAHRPDWRVIDNPFAPSGLDGGDPIVLIPAIAPDVALLHAAMADRHGNVWVGRQRECATMAHAARRALVTVERVVDADFLADETLAPGVISSIYVEAFAVAARGARPARLLDLYPFDDAWLAAYARVAASPAGFTAWLSGAPLAAAA